jgi:hypothetical protein
MRLGQCFSAICEFTGLLNKSLSSSLKKHAFTAC